MTPTGVVAGLVPPTDGGQRRELAAGTGTKLVNGAGHRSADFPAQGDTARRLGGGAAHTGHLRPHRFGQPRRHPAGQGFVKFVAMKGDAIDGATGAAGLAGIGHGA